MRHSINSGRTLPALAVAGVLATQNAQALSFQPTDELTVDWDTTVSYGAAWRMQAPNDELLEDVNGDDGNRNFKKGAMINNRVSVISEADFQYRNLGAFVRGSAFYDGAYFGETDNDSEGTFNGYGQHNRFSDAVKDVHGRRARLLDAFAYGNFDIGERNLSLRVGQQVVNWGTSLYIPGLSTAQGPADQSKSVLPGVEVKDIYLPVGQVLAQFDVTDNLVVSGYSQWEWKKTEVNESGSYFSYSDVLDDAGGEMYLPNGFGGYASIPRAEDGKARDDGQWGIAFEYYAESLGAGTDLGFYYINYHDKSPTLNFNTVYNPQIDRNVPTSYYLDYLEDIKLTGASFSTVLGDTNVAGEFSHRKGVPVLVTASSIPVKGTIAQIQFSAIHSFGKTAIADDILFSGEVGYNRVLDVNEGGYKVDDLTSDRSGSGMAGNITLKYNNIARATNLEIPINFKHNFRGNSGAGTFTNGQNTDQISVGATAFYKDSWEGGVNYTAYLGKPADNKLTDRDFFSINVKYSF